MTKFLNFFNPKSTELTRPFALAALSGVLVGTSYIPFPGWALFFCYAPLWLAVSALQLDLTRINYKKIFLLGWMTQFIFTLIGFNWIFFVSSEFGQLPFVLSAGALLLFAGLMHTYVPVSLLLASFIISHFKITHRLVQLLLYALTLALLERIWPSIFEWNLGYSLLWMKWPLYQWADTVGFWGLSTWLLVAQAFVTYGFIFWKSKRKKTFQIVGFTAALFIALSYVGTLKEKTWSHFDQTLKFGVVQGNVGNADKVQSEQQRNFQKYILNLYVDLTEKHLRENPETEIMLWPETAMPFALDQSFLERTEQRQLLDQITQWKKPLVTGAYSVDPQKKDHLGNWLVSNAVFFLGPNSTPLADTYDKTDLLVFGEYMPLGRHFPFLYKLLPFVGNYKIGPGPSLREVQLSDKKIRLGPQICYESLNPGFSRGLATAGAQIIFNVTNDSWFGWWAEPFQHQIMTLGRAIEVRRPLLRSTNTGISSVILANGQRLQDSPINMTWSHTYEISYLENPPQSPYTKWGHFDWLLWAAIAIALIYYNRKQGTHV